MPHSHLVPFVVCLVPVLVVSDLSCVVHPILFLIEYALSSPLATLYTGLYIEFALQLVLGVRRPVRLLCVLPLQAHGMRHETPLVSCFLDSAQNKA